MDRTITARLGNKDHDLVLLCARVSARKEARKRNLSSEMFLVLPNGQASVFWVFFLSNSIAERYYHQRVSR